MSSALPPCVSRTQCIHRQQLDTAALLPACRYGPAALVCRRWRQSAEAPELAPAAARLRFGSETADAQQVASQAAAFCRWLRGPAASALQRLELSVHAPSRLSVTGEDYDSDGCHYSSFADPAHEPLAEAWVLAQAACSAAAYQLADCCAALCAVPGARLAELELRLNCVPFAVTHVFANMLSLRKLAVSIQGLPGTCDPGPRLPPHFLPALLMPACTALA